MRTSTAAFAQGACVLAVALIAHGCAKAGLPKDDANALETSICRRLSVESHACRGRGPCSKCAVPGVSIERSRETAERIVTRVGELAAKYPILSDVAFGAKRIEVYDLAEDFPFPYIDGELHFNPGARLEPNYCPAQRMCGSHVVPLSPDWASLYFHFSTGPAHGEHSHPFACVGELTVEYYGLNVAPSLMEDVCGIIDDERRRLR
jgi:hypothetical protein